MNKDIYNSMHRHYPVGCRVKLVKAHKARTELGEHQVPLGTCGTVKNIKNGNISVAWDNGMRFSVLFGKDIIWKLDDMRDYDRSALPCPFCGGKAYISCNVSDMLITCSDCGCYVTQDFLSIGKGIARERLLERWNTRTPI